MLRILIIISSCLPFAAQASDDRFWYLGLSGAYTPSSDNRVSGTGGINTVDYDGSLSASVNLGYSDESRTLGGDLIGEFEFSIADRGFSANGGSFQSYTFAYNYFYKTDFETIAPYFGAGVGYMELDSTGFNPNFIGREGDFIYQLMGGLEYDAGFEDTTFFTGYKYVSSIDDLEFKNNAGGSNRVDYTSHDFEVGLKYRIKTVK